MQNARGIQRINAQEKKGWKNDKKRGKKESYWMIWKSVGCSCLLLTRQTARREGINHGKKGLSQNLTQRHAEKITERHTYTEPCLSKSKSRQIRENTQFKGINSPSRSTKHRFPHPPYPYHTKFQFPLPNVITRSLNNMEHNGIKK